MQIILHQVHDNDLGLRKADFGGSWGERAEGRNIFEQVGFEIARGGDGK